MVTRSSTHVPATLAGTELCLAALAAQCLASQQGPLLRGELLEVMALRMAGAEGSRGGARFVRRMVEAQAFLKAFKT